MTCPVRATMIIYIRLAGLIYMQRASMTRCCRRKGGGKREILRKSLHWALVGNNKADINRAGERKNEQRTLVVRGVCWLLVGWSMWRRV